MYLKSIKISGFKSFANPVELKFKSQISGIVGPNGSGKSNTAEAFRFVLGEQSMKNMRGKKGEDLIFTGKNGRLNRAAVKVIFDNSDKKLNIDYNEVVIERVVYRDGTNEYFINGSKVRVKDIQELLASANIGSSGHHIISQGEADKILSISPKDRKNVLEEALGLKAFVMKKRESQRKLEQTEENLKEIKIRERINGPRLRFLEKEVQKIHRVKELKEELLNLYEKFFPHKKKYQNQILELNKKLEVLEKEKLELEEKWKAEKQKLEESQNNLNLDKRKEEIQEALKKLDAEILDLENKLKNSERELSKIDFELERQNQEYQDFLNLKNRTEENLKKYQEKVKGVANLIGGFLRVDAERFVALAENILEFLEIKRVPEHKLSFSEEELERNREKRFELKNSLINLEKELQEKKEKRNELYLDLQKDNQSLGQEIRIKILELEKEISEQKGEFNKIMNDKINALKKVQEYEKEETYFMSIFGVEKLKKYFDLEIQEEQEPNLYEKIIRIRALVENNEVNLTDDLESEYKELKEKQEFIKKEVDDLENAKKELLKLIAEVENEIEKRFRGGVEQVNTEFNKFFSTLFMGGKAEIVLVKVPVKNKDESKMEEFDLGLDIKVSLPNKKISGLGMLSGGERSLTSIALLFAMSSITPPPFIILDETDAALDEANSKRYGDMIEKLAEHSQLILITHNRETMSRAGILYGVTMDQAGVSKVLSISFEEGERFAK